MLFVVPACIFNAKSAKSAKKANSEKSFRNFHCFRTFRIKNTIFVATVSINLCIAAKTRINVTMLRLGVFLTIVILTILGCCLPQFAAYPVAASPLVALAALFGGQRAFALFVALLLAAPCIVKRRFFCRLFCPLGFCFDVIGNIRKRATGSNLLPRLLRDFPNIGIFLMLWTLFGCGIGVVGFLWLDPLVLFGSPFRNGVWLWVVLLAVLALALFAPTLWCRAICPLGGVQDVLSIPKSLTSKPPFVVHSEQRRRLCQWVLFLVLFGGMFEYVRRRTSALAANAPLRPPGAVAEPRFLALCTRCGTCMQVCPANLLTTNTENASLLDWGTPHINYDPAWCHDDCHACTQVCPSGALRPIDLDKKRDTKMGLAVFDFESCRLYEDIECSLCGRSCPVEAISYQWSEAEYRRIVQIDAERCTGCGRCLVSCPIKGTQRPLDVKSVTGRND